MVTMTLRTPGTKRMDKKPHKPEQKPEETVDLFPKAPADEEGIRVPTYGGFEVVLPMNLVTPNTNFAETAPEATGKQKRRSQRRKSPRRHQVEVNGENEAYRGTDVGGTAGAGNGDAAPPRYDLTTLAGAAPQLEEALARYVDLPSPGIWRSILGAIAGVAATGVFGLFNNRR